MIFQFVDIQEIEQRFGDIEETIQTADQSDRAITTKLTWQMAQEKIVARLGCGVMALHFPDVSKEPSRNLLSRLSCPRGVVGPEDLSLRAQ